MLAPRTIGLHIQCEGLRQVAWMVNDERVASRVRNLMTGPDDDLTSARYSTDALFGLGVTAFQKPIGGYRVTALTSQGSREGDAVAWGYQTGGHDQSLWQPAGAAIPVIPGIMRLTPVDTNSHPAAIRQITVPLRITTAIITEDLNLQDETLLQGEATVSLIYL